MRRIRTPRETFDDPWKQIVPALFEQFVEFFAPDVWSDIDWSRPPEFLDKELRRVAKGLRRRRVTADFLVRVYLKDGDDFWLLAHIELQAQKDVALPERMFRYNFRAFDLHGRPVYSLALLADGDSDWRPDHFEYKAWRTRMALDYSTVKLLDFANRIDQLQKSDNPFALAVLAHLKTLETRGDAEARLEWKSRLVRLLYSRRWRRGQIEELFQFIDWIMGLPDELEERFELDYVELERSRTMAQAMPPIIRRAQERGERIGERRARRSMLLRYLEQHFGAVPDKLQTEIEAVDDLTALDRLIDCALAAKSLEEFTASLS